MKVVGAPRYRATLTEEEPKELEAMTRRGKIEAEPFVFYQCRALLLREAGLETFGRKVPDAD
jgi:hypothetical protein